MNHRPTSIVATAVLAFPLAVSCGGGGGGGTGTFVENLSIAVCDPSAGPFSISITNPFLPLPVGREIVLEGEEDGESVRQVISVSGETEVVGGVVTLVVVEDEMVDGEQVEISRNFVVQAADGTVCYYGEDVQIFEDGVVVSDEGEWRVGEDGAIPGILMPANPMVGDMYRQEVAPGEAEDRGTVVALGESVTVPAGTFTDTVTVSEDTPLDPGEESTKIHARDVGIVFDDGLELTSFR